MDPNLVCYLNETSYAAVAQYTLLTTVTVLACARVAGVGTTRPPVNKDVEAH